MASLFSNLFKSSQKAPISQLFGEQNPFSSVPANSKPTTAAALDVVHSAASAGVASLLALEILRQSEEDCLF